MERIDKALHKAWKKLVAAITVLIIILSLFFGIPIIFPPSGPFSTTNTYTTSASDGNIRGGVGTTTNWGSTCYGVSSGTVYNTTGVSGIVGGRRYISSSNIYFYKSFLYFDTSNVPESGIVVTSVILSVNFTNLYQTGTYNAYNITVYTPETAYTYPGNPMVATDYDYLNYNDSVEVSRLNVSAITVNAYNNFTLTTTSILTTGTTKLLLETDEMHYNSTWDTHSEWWQANANESSLGPPKLYVTYSNVPQCTTYGATGAHETNENVTFYSYWTGGTFTSCYGNFSCNITGYTSFSGLLSSAWYNVSVILPFTTGYIQYSFGANNTDGQWGTIGTIVMQITAPSTSHQLIIRPTAEDTIQLTPSTGTDNSALVDESVANDTDYVYDTYSGNYQRDLYVMENVTIPSDGTISSVNPYFRCKYYQDESGTVSTHASAVIKVNSTEYGSDGQQLTDSWVLYNSGGTTYWTVNPKTTVTWTETDINNMLAGPRLYTADGAKIIPYCSQFYVEVNYTTPEYPITNTVTPDDYYYTQNLENVSFTAQWYTPAYLDWAGFSWNESGTWSANETIFNDDNTILCWSNISKVLTSTSYDKYVGWKIYCNDSNTLYTTLSRVLYHQKFVNITDGFYPNQRNVAMTSDGRIHVVGTTSTSVIWQYSLYDNSIMYSYNLTEDGMTPSLCVTSGDNVVFIWTRASAGPVLHMRIATVSKVVTPWTWTLGTEFHVSTGVTEGGGYFPSVYASGIRYYVAVLRQYADQPWIYSTYNFTNVDQTNGWQPWFELTGFPVNGTVAFAPINSASDVECYLASASLNGSDVIGTVMYENFTVGTYYTIATGTYYPPSLTSYANNIGNIFAVVSYTNGTAIFFKRSSSLESPQSWGTEVVVRSSGLTSWRDHSVTSYDLGDAEVYYSINNIHSTGDLISRRTITFTSFLSEEPITMNSNGNIYPSTSLVSYDRRIAYVWINNGTATSESTSISIPTPLIVNERGTIESYHQKNFNFLGRYWAFYSYDDDYYYASYVSGDTDWTTTAYYEEPITTFAYSDFEVFWMAEISSVTYVYRLYCTEEWVGADLYLQRGTAYSNGTIIWGSLALIYDTSYVGKEQLTEDAVCVDENGYPYVIYNLGVVATGSGGLDANWTKFVSKSSTNDGTWSTASGYPKNLTISVPKPMGGSLFYLGSNNYYVISSKGTYDNPLFGFYWNSTTSSFSDNTTISNPLDDIYSFNACMDENYTIHVVWNNNSNSNWFEYRKRFINGTWSSIEPVYNCGIDQSLKPRIYAYGSIKEIYFGGTATPNTGLFKIPYSNGEWREPLLINEDPIYGGWMLSLVSSYQTGSAGVGVGYQVSKSTGYYLVYVLPSQSALSAGWNTVLPWYNDYESTLGEVNASLNLDNIDWTFIDLEYPNFTRYVFVYSFSYNADIIVVADSTFRIYCNTANIWYHEYP